MALIPKFFVVATEYPIAHDAATIKMGQLVKMDASGTVEKYAGSGVVIGVAGDTNSSSASSMPGIADGWQNRVSDSFNETKASGKMTVYTNGGEFATDMFESDVHSAEVGAYLYASTGGNLQSTNPGSATPIAVLTRAPGPYPSGVPGVDVPSYNDMALKGEDVSGTANVYIEYKLLI
jgi:hypothetical protein